MKTTIFSILLTISSIAFADDKLNFDNPCSSENGVYTVVAKEIRDMLDVPLAGFGDEKSQQRIDKVKTAHENAAKALEELCKTMSEVMGDAQ